MDHHDMTLDWLDGKPVIGSDGRQIGAVADVTSTGTRTSRSGRS